MNLPAKYQDRRICIVGLGYVGLTLAVAMAEVGFEVIGVERDAAVVDAISQGRAHFSESGLDPRLAAQVARGRLKASVDWPEKGHSSVFVVTVGTPLGHGHVTNLESISAVASRIAELMTNGAMVVLRSTVRVGVSREIVKPLLDSANVRYDLAFCPERTLEGKALVELRSLPQIIGGFDEDSALRASHMFNFLTPTTIRVCDLETAEMIKLINNTQRDLMFAFANEVAEMCDAIGVSAVDVISAGNMGYARASMPMPGPVGGPCLEKDPYILAEGVALNGGSARLALMGRTLNEEMPARVVERVRANVRDHASVSKIAIAGLAFKGRPETSDLRGSMVTPLIAALAATFPGAQLYGYDPAVPPVEVAKLGVIHAETPNEAFDQADCVIFQNNNERFGLLDMPALSRRLKPDAVIYDMWNQFDAETLALRADVRYFGFGTLVLRERSAGADATDVARA